MTDMKFRSLTEFEQKYLQMALDTLIGTTPVGRTEVWAAGVLKEMVPDLLWREK